jgi:hypothetical protein
VVGAKRRLEVTTTSRPSRPFTLGPGYDTQPRYEAIGRGDVIRKWMSIDAELHGRLLDEIKQRVAWHELPPVPLLPLQDHPHVVVRSSE